MTASIKVAVLFILLVKKVHNWMLASLFDCSLWHWFLLEKYFFMTRKSLVENYTIKTTPKNLEFEFNFYVFRVNDHTHQFYSNFCVMSENRIVKVSFWNKAKGPTVFEGKSKQKSKFHFVALHFLKPFFIRAFLFNFARTIILKIFEDEEYSDRLSCSFEISAAGNEFLSLFEVFYTLWTISYIFIV